jgi:hypothetical protein
MATVTRLPSLLIALLLTLLLCGVDAASIVAQHPPVLSARGDDIPTAQTTVNFEDRTPSPDLIQNQYLGTHGAAFDGAKIIVPAAGTSSGRQALRASGFQAEFHQDPLIITFAHAQSAVRMRVGLAEVTVAPVRAVLQAYNGAGAPVGQAAVTNIGPGPTAITTELAVAHGGDIREVRLHYENSAYFETLDDLTFELFPPAAPETRAPIVRIWTPSEGELTHFSTFQLVGEIEEESPLADVRLTIAQAGITPVSYQITVDGGPPISDLYFFGGDTQYGQLFVGQNRITVTATDIYGNVGQGAVAVTYEALPPPPPPLLDLYPTAIEVTQGIQDKVAQVVGPPNNAPVGYGGAVPLIAGKPTVVRLYGRVVNAGGSAAGVPAELWGYRSDNGAVLPGSPFQPSTGPITLTPGETVNAQRARVDGAWVFELPLTWTQSGAIRLLAMVNPGQAVAECSTCYNTGNRLNAPYLAFNDMPMLHIYPFWACVRRSPADPVNRCDMVSPLAPVALLSARDSILPVVLPVADMDLHLPANPIIYIDGDFNNGGRMTSSRVSALLSKLAFRRTADLVGGVYRCYNVLPDSGPSCFTVARNHTYLALMPPPVGAWSGLSRSGKSVAVALFDPAFLNGTSATVAHEVSHAIDLGWHAPSDTSASCDPNVGFVNNSYPQTYSPEGAPYPRASIGTWGFDPRPPCTPASLHDPALVYDYMSYCSPNWSSSYTFRQLHNVLRTKFTLGHDYVVNPYPSRSEPTADAEYIWVAGEIDAADQVTLQPFYRFTLPAGGEAIPGASPYLLEMRSSAGTVLATHNLDVAIALAGADDEPPAAFAALLPFPPETNELRVARAGQTLASRAVSAHAPQVDLTTPAGGEQWPASGQGAIAWSGSDGDGDALFYAVQYSLDNGASWQTLAENLTASPLNVDLAWLAGAAQAQVRVFATDGVHTAMDQTSSPFSVTNKPPLVAISAPQDGASVTSGQTVLARGLATDPEDGPLAGEQLHWQLDGAIDLGAGQEIQLVRLAAGVHRLTLRGMDSSGATASVTNTFTVTMPAFAVAFTQLNLDAICTDAATHLLQIGWATTGGAGGVYVDRVAVGSQNLDLAPIAGPLPATGATTTRVNLGGGGSATVSIRVMDGSGKVATAMRTLPLAHCLATGLTVDRAPLDFASVTVGSSHTKTLTLANVGTQAVTVNGLDEPATPFYMVAAPQWPLVLAPGVSASIDVRFSPQVVGAENATLGVHLAATTVQISLAGEGVAAPTAWSSLYLPVIER